MRALRDIPPPQANFHLLFSGISVSSYFYAVVEVA